MTTANAPNAEKTPPEFGRRIAGQQYVSRPGAYVVLFDGAGKIAVLDTPRGGFLPGGGIETGETPEEALQREVGEECGLRTQIGRRLGKAIEWVYTPGNAAGIRKDCVFFAAEVDGAGGAAMEPGHILVWLTPAEAKASLRHQSQVWAVRRAEGVESPQPPIMGAGSTPLTGLIRPRACGALLKNGSVLMVRHADPTRIFWTLPGGGVGVDETPAEAAEREVWEETGLRAIAGRLLFEAVYDDASSPEYCFLMAADDVQGMKLGFDPEEAHLTRTQRQLQGVEWLPLNDMQNDLQVSAVLAAMTDEEKEAAQ